MVKTSVLIVAPSLTLAGMEGQLVTLLKHVDPAEFDIELALFRDLPGPLRDELPPYVKITDLGKKGKFDLRFYARLFSALKATKSEVINSKISGVNELLMLFCGWLKRDGLVLEIQSTKAYLAPYYRLMKAAFSVFQRKWTVLCNNHKAVDELRAYLPSHTAIVFVGSGLDLGKFCRTALPKTGAPFHIGFVGRVVPLKNLETLVKALEQIKKQTDLSEFHLTIVGRRADSAYSQRLSALLKASEMERHVTFHEFIDKVEDFYNQLDVFVLPSLFEGTPTVLLEAMACERVCLVSEGANTDHFLSGEYQFQTHDFIDLAAKLRRIKNLGPVQREEIGKANRNLVRQQYSVDAMAANYGKVWRLAAGRAQ